MRLQNFGYYLIYLIGLNLAATKKVDKVECETYKIMLFQSNIQQLEQAL